MSLSQLDILIETAATAGINLEQFLNERDKQTLWITETDDRNIYNETDVDVALVRADTEQAAIAQAEESLGVDHDEDESDYETTAKPYKGALMIRDGESLVWLSPWDDLRDNQPRR